MTRDIRTEEERKRPKIIDADIPEMYNEVLPFDNWTLLKDWDDSLFGQDIVPANLTSDQLSNLRKARKKFERYVSARGNSNSLFQISEFLCTLFLHFIFMH